MFNLASLYHPLTAQAANFEGCMPCAVLKPFVANYWGTEDVSQEGMGFEPLLVVPDTCMDVIFTINHTTGVVSGELCGMGETAMVFPPLLTTEAVSTFAIRFYFWSIHFYSGFHLRNTAGNYNDADLYFNGWNRNISARPLRKRPILCVIKTYGMILFIMNTSTCKTRCRDTGFATNRT